LRQTSAFTPIKSDELDFIDAFRSCKSAVPAGGTIIYEQESSGKLFTLYSGWAFCYKTLSDGRRATADP
jgi:CRP-like cAMP-binding protein